MRDAGSTRNLVSHCGEHRKALTTTEAAAVARVRREGEPGVGRWEGELGAEAIFLCADVS
jgi:hypothetical protein